MDYVLELMGFCAENDRLRRAFSFREQALLTPLLNLPDRTARLGQAGGSTSVEKIVGAVCSLQRPNHFCRRIHVLRYDCELENVL